MRIGILETGKVPEGFEEKHGNYAAMFEAILAGNGFSFTNYEVVESKLPESVFDEEGWIITGSRHGAYENHPWIMPLEAFIREAYDKDIPLLGICFGHQILAQALGGKVEKFHSGWAAGHTTYRFDDGKEVDLFAMHQDQVVELPPDARTFAGNEFCRNAAIAYKGAALSYQPHPEFKPEFLGDLIRLRSGQVFSEDFADKALQNLNKDHDSQAIARDMALFLKENRRLGSGAA